MNRGEDQKRFAAAGTPRRIGRPGGSLSADVVRDAMMRLRAQYGRPARRARSDVLAVLVQTVLSQHTSDRNAERAYRELRRRFPSWAALACAEPEAIAEAIRSAGLARVRARRLRGMLGAIRRRFGSYTLAPLQQLDDAEAMARLRSLPGVGPKTAACVLLFALGRDVCPVDTHIHRIARRLGWVPQRAHAERTQELLAPHVPRGHALELHLNLIRHGREICRARRPRCERCALAAVCPSSRIAQGNLPA